MVGRVVLCAVGLVPGLCGVVMGQVTLERFERQLEQIRRETQLLVEPSVPPEQRAVIDYGGFVSFNFLAIDDLGQNTHILRQTDVVVYTRLNFDGVHELFARVRSTYRDFNSGDSFDGNGDDWVEPTLDRAIYTFNLGRYIETNEGRTPKGNIIIRGGRQLVHWANGVTLSQEIDGGVVTLSYDPLTLDIVAGITRHSITDIDSSRPGFEGDTKRGFYGAMLSVQAGANHRPFIYGLVQDDRNDPTVLIVGATTTRFDYNSYYIGAGSTGALSDNLLYGVELIYEGGEGLSNSFNNTTLVPIAQTREDIHAFAADVTLDYLVGDSNRSRLSGEMILATGDTDRLTTTNTFAGNQTGTDDNAFNAFGLINTGLAFNPNVSNLLMFRIGASTFPLHSNQALHVGAFDRLQVGVDLFIFNKLNRNAPIDEATSASTYLGFETDVFVTWQLTSDLTVSTRYGVFFPGDAITTDLDERHFFFTGVTLAF
ncbi:MAG: alginate export family protein [Phycisphaeraceae bacterium]